MNHPTPTNAMRLEQGGRSWCIPRDTGESEELVELADDADVLLCEASVGADEEYVPDLHLTGRRPASTPPRPGSSG